MKNNLIALSYILALTCSPVLATTVLAQSVGEKTGTNSTLGIAPTTQDFVTEAAESDMFEIQSSQLAETKGGSKTKTFAAKMVEDHTKTTSELKALVDSGKVNVPLPQAMSPAQQTMLTDLSNLKGMSFVKKYDSDQVSAHKDAVSLFQRYADKGDNPDLKAFAQQTLPTLKQHLAMAQALHK